MSRENLTAEYIRSIIHYNPETGVFTWLSRRIEHFTDGKYPSERKAAIYNRRWAGSVAGTINDKGYRIIGVDNSDYYAHRIAWLYMTGAWPSDQVDHKNLDKADNRWGNLREATNSQNNANRLARKDNVSGVKGVRWCRRDKKWIARIKKDGDRHTLGYFTSLEEAAAAYEAAATKMFGDYARTGADPITACPPPRA